MIIFNTMYKSILFTFVLVFAFNGYSQNNKEKNKNQSKRQIFYFDPINKSKIESQGYFYVDELGETTERQGKWTCFNEEGVIVEERNYHTNKLDGEVKTHYGKNRVKNSGYFEYELQES